MTGLPGAVGDGAATEREQRYERVLCWVRDELRSRLEDDSPEAAQQWWPVAARLVGVLDGLLDEGPPPTG